MVTLPDPKTSLGEDLSSGKEARPRRMAEAPCIFSELGALQYRIARLPRPNMGALGARPAISAPEGGRAHPPRAQHPDRTHSRRKVLHLQKGEGEQGGGKRRGRIVRDPKGVAPVHTIKKVTVCNRSVSNYETMMVWRSRRG